MNALDEPTFVYLYPAGSVLLRRVYDKEGDYPIWFQYTINKQRIGKYRTRKFPSYSGLIYSFGGFSEKKIYSETNLLSYDFCFEEALLDLLREDALAALEPFLNGSLEQMTQWYITHLGVSQEYAYKLWYIQKPLRIACMGWARTKEAFASANIPSSEAEVIYAKLCIWRSFLLFLSGMHAQEMRDLVKQHVLLI